MGSISARIIRIKSKIDAITEDHYITVHLDIRRKTIIKVIEILPLLPIMGINISIIVKTLKNAEMPSTPLCGLCLVYGNSQNIIKRQVFFTFEIECIINFQDTYLVSDGTRFQTQL